MPATSAFLEAFADVSSAVESGAGLPEVARATSRALGASVVVLDASGSVLAVAARSPADEQAVLSEGQVLELRVADATVGELRYRGHADTPPQVLVRYVGTLIGLEVERSRAPERASEAAISSFLRDLLDRKVTDRENIVARGHELGADLELGASVVVARAHPQHAEEGDWRARVLAIVERGARGPATGALAAAVDWTARDGRPRPGNHDGEIVIVTPGADHPGAMRVAQAVLRELEANLPGYHLSVAVSRPATDPADIHRAGAEALLAANVAEAQSTPLLAFEETGAYRILLPAMIEDPAELQRFHDDTVAPLIAYDEQYDTELLRTLESFLEADGNVAKTAQKLFTHRHTIRYRLERVRELTGGLDVGSTDGRERLGLGLKAMRVLGIAPPHGPASERGAQAGQVPHEEQDRL
jgi:sugar diacid utilization regulator